MSQETVRDTCPERADIVPSPVSAQDDVAKPKGIAAAGSASRDELELPPEGTRRDEPTKGRLFGLAFASLGVVYGDIGTSPLYALRQSLAHSNMKGLDEETVLGTVSLLLWALFLVVTAKYVLFLMQANNKGEGGTLSLMALARRAVGHRSLAVFFLGVAGAALFSGEAIITPAISVMSAVEGLQLVTPFFEAHHDYVLMLVVLILVSLFFVQRSGTARVAAFFGPIMVVFFAVIALLGLVHIGDAPRIFAALNPIHGLRFLIGHGFVGFVVLGSVFLAVTGAEALYADMGHFGHAPIRLAWLCFVLPALALNYLGQGALVLATPDAVDNPFYRLAPAWALLPLVILSTLATVIASQSVITGTFSLARQAIQLGLLPRMMILHTSETREGQIFIPRINRMMLIGVIGLVLLFKSSSAIGSAYGIAVAGTMVVDTALAFIVMRALWKWPTWAAAAFASIFLVGDLAFLAANLAKVLDGGWVPLVLATATIIIMWTWVRGNAMLAAKTQRDSIPTVELIRMLEHSKPQRVAGTAIFLTNHADTAPSSLMHNLKHNKALHERVMIMSVKTEISPRVPAARRFEIEKVSDDFTKVILHYGYMESPRIPSALALLRKSGLKFDIMTTSFFVGRRTIKTSPTSGMPLWQDNLFVALSKQAANATDFFAIPSDRVVELGAQVTV